MTLQVRVPTYRTIVCLLRAASIILLSGCQAQSFPDYLTMADFWNSQFVDETGPSQPPRLMGDQHFQIKGLCGGIGDGQVAIGSYPVYFVLSLHIVDAMLGPNSSTPHLAATQRAVLAKAIAAYNAKTCIRFVPKQPADRDYIVISKLDGCYADFAKVGGRQQVSLADECIDYSTVIHEFMHVIGFIHEHQREDRDGFVKINYENIIDGANADFDKLSAAGLSNYGETYDYFSIMHYESTEGSRNGKSTIEARVGQYTPLMGKSTGRYKVYIKISHGVTSAASTGHTSVMGTSRQRSRLIDGAN